MKVNFLYDVLLFCYIATPQKCNLFSQYCNSFYHLLSTIMNTFHMIAAV